MILQDAGGNSWKLAGYYPRLNSIGGHDGQWFLSKAREYKDKGQTYNAWFYYLTAWDLTAPVDFMGTPQLDKIADEIQAARPGDLPRAARHWNWRRAERHLRSSTWWRSRCPAIWTCGRSTKQRTRPIRRWQQRKLAVSKALLRKYPEFRDAFGAVIARAADNNGHTYTTLTPMNDIK